MGPEALAQVLRPLRDLAGGNPDLLVGLQVSDDAAVYRLNDQQAIIQTTDFFPPVVDDPYTYGAVAAANAMSDVYAMGGEVLLALNIAGWPDGLSPALLSEIFRGGAEKVAEAGGVVAGGHTITDHEPKYGLAVTGLVHPDRIITKSAARPGDVLVLTKPLGSGILTTAGRAGAASPEHLKEAIDWMLRLNRASAQAMQTAGVHAATDITGYALLGHGYEMAENSGVGLRLVAEQIPILASAPVYAAQGHRAGGLGRNRRYFQSKVQVRRDLDPAIQDVLFDPQTSGGLLIAVGRDHLATLEAELRARSQPFWVIGEVVDGTGIEIV